MDAYKNGAAYSRTTSRSHILTECKTSRGPPDSFRVSTTYGRGAIMDQRTKNRAQLRRVIALPLLYTGIAAQMVERKKKKQRQWRDSTSMLQEV